MDLKKLDCFWLGLRQVCGRIMHRKPVLRSHNATQNCPSQKSQGKCAATMQSAYRLYDRILDRIVDLKLDQQTDSLCSDYAVCIPDMRPHSRPQNRIFWKTLFLDFLYHRSVKTWHQGIHDPTLAPRDSWF